MHLFDEGAQGPGSGCARTPGVRLGRGGRSGRGVRFAGPGVGPELVVPVARVAARVPAGLRGHRFPGGRPAAEDEQRGGQGSHPSGANGREDRRGEGRCAEAPGGVRTRMNVSSCGGGESSTWVACLELPRRAVHHRRPAVKATGAGQHPIVRHVERRSSNRRDHSSVNGRPSMSMTSAIASRGKGTAVGRGGARVRVRGARGKGNSARRRH